jgi:hypothetical protein
MVTTLTIGWVTCIFLYMLNNTNTESFKFSITRTRGGDFCKAEIELRDRNGTPELSICGVAGVVMSKREARKEALAYWVSFFEECPEEMVSMNQRCGRRFTSPNGAARFVLEEDGEFHGLDITAEGRDRVFLGQSFGQIREDLAEWFPELQSLFVWHLNGMKAGCVHQALQGRTFATDPGHECPSCGTVLGHAWYTWALPAGVLARVEALKALA